MAANVLIIRFPIVVANYYCSRTSTAVSGLRKIANRETHDRIMSWFLLKNITNSTVSRRLRRFFNRSSSRQIR